MLSWFSSKYATGKFYNNFKDLTNKYIQAGQYSGVSLFSLLNTMIKAANLSMANVRRCLEVRKYNQKFRVSMNLLNGFVDKQRYFTEQLSLLDRNKKKEGSPLRVQRAFALAGNRKISKTITYPDSITELATLIRSRNATQKKQNWLCFLWQPIHLFLGHYSSTMSAWQKQKKNVFMKPKYKEFATPLLTENGQTGEIQILVNELIKKLYEVYHVL